MDFRLIWQIEGLIIWDTLGDFELASDRSYVVNIRRPGSHEMRDGPDREAALCIVSTTCKLRKLARQALAEASNFESDIAFAYFPVDIQEIISALQRRMEAVALEVVDLVRWKLGVLGRHNPLQYRQFQFRIGVDDWHTITSIGSFRYNVLTPHTTGSRLQGEIQAALASGRQAPIGHSLLREARDQWPSTPRSALILAVAALEVGIKHCLVELDPGLEIDVIESAGQSVLTLVTSELESVIDRCCPDLLDFLPPKSIRSLLEKAIQSRNLIVHRPKRMTDVAYLKAMTNLSPTWVDDLLKTVSNLL